MLSLNLMLFTLLLLVFQQQSSLVLSSDVNNFTIYDPRDNKTLLFSVVQSNTNDSSLKKNSILQLSNPHRTVLSSKNDNSNLKPQIRLSLPGVEVNKISKDANHQNKWSLQLSDHSRIELTLLLNQEQNTSQWNLHWKDKQTKSNNSNSTENEICFHYGFNNASWYNSYQSSNHTFPMDPRTKNGRHQFGFLHSSLYDYPNEFHAILEYLFINSDGFALLLSQQVPWFIRFDDSATNRASEPKFCLSASASWPYNSLNKDPKYQNLDLNIFTSKNIRSVTDHVVHHSGLLPKPTKIPEFFSQFSLPTWSTFVTDLFHRKTEDELVELQKNLTKFHFQNLTNDILVEIYFEEKMSRNLGNHYADKFPPSLERSIKALHSEHQKFGVLVNGVVDDRTTDNEGYFLKTNLNSNSNTKPNCLDFSSAETQEYWTNLVESMRRQESLDTFHLLNYDFDQWTRSFVFHNQTYQNQPSLFTKTYVEIGSSFAQVTQMAFRNQDLPVFIQLYPYFFHSEAEKLLHLIPSVLSLSTVGGYPYLSVKSYLGPKPSSEQYIRFLQASSLLVPQLTIAHAPWGFENQNENSLVLEQTRRYLQLHHDHSQLMIKLAKERIQTGAPIVRPLWYLEPDDRETYSISDQFALGSDLIVAPVLLEGQRSRRVYLPRGEWLDAEGTVFAGQSWHTVKAELQDLPRFHRKN